MVHVCLVYHAAGVAGLDWSAVAERLKLHDLWDRDVERGLSVCEAAMLETLAVVRERQRPNG